jgi:Autotransporter beta-domain
MSVALRSIKKVKRAALVLAALAAASVGWSSGSVAQCHNDFNFGVASVGPGASVKNLNPTTSPLISITNTVNTAFFTNTTAFVSAPGVTKPNQDTGGIWARTVGGAVDTQAITTDRPVASPNFGPPGGATGTQICHQSNNHSYTGVQVGADIGNLNIGSSGGNVHFGIMSGILTASARDTTPGITVFGPGGINLNNTYAPGDLTADFRVPFLGAYGVYTQGNFAADIQARWDWYESRSFNPGNNYSGLVNDAQGISIAGGMYYRLTVQNWFAEPSLGGVWSRVQVNPLTTPLALGALATGTLRVEDIQSLLGRASVRVGVNLTQGMYTWQPFVVASAIHEFSGDVKSTLSISDPVNAPAPSLFEGMVLASTTSRIGTYGQFGAGMSVVAGSTGWLGYGRVDVKVGDNVEGVGVNMGLRYQW